MVFDLSIRGHHPSYIKYLISGWDRQKCSGTLLIVVSPLFLTEHSDVLAFAETRDHGRIEFCAITPEENSALKSRKSAINRALRTFQEWNLLCHYAEKLAATDCFLPYFDTFQLPIILGRSCPCTVSGIYFRPTFHYGSFESYKPAVSDFLQHWREKLRLLFVLRRPEWRVLFCLDPFAVEWMRDHYNVQKLVALPDPVSLPDSLPSEADLLKRDLLIEPDRQVFLLFGAITSRKGVYQLLQAVELLSAEDCRQICFLFVGESNLKQDLTVRIEKLCNEKPIQIIQQYQFVSDAMVPLYFQLSDIVLAPYQEHVGMSGILLQAAASRTPVLGSNYGLMGEMTRRYGLGITVESTNPEAIAEGILQCLTSPREELANDDRMRHFAEQNTDEKFASIIFENLFAPSLVKSCESAVLSQTRKE